MSLWKRLLGAAIGGGGTYAAMTLYNPWGLTPPIAIAAAGAIAIAGFAFGPKVWDAVIHLA